MLKDAHVATRLPAQDLERARRFYSEKLGLDPVEERDGGLLYRCASGEFALFASTGRPSGSHTQIAFTVDDVDAVVAALAERGVELARFEGVDEGIVYVEGNYPSKGHRRTRRLDLRQRGQPARHRRGRQGLGNGVPHESDDAPHVDVPADSEHPGHEDSLVERR